MSKEHELIERVVSFLINNGYPNESILREYAIHGANNRICRVDIAIVEPGQSQPVAIFEVKAGPFSQILGKAALQQMQYYVSLLRGPIRSFVVFAADNQIGFAMIDAFVCSGRVSIEREYERQQKDAPHIVPFENLVRGNIAERTNARIDKREIRQDSLVRLRWIGIMFLCILFFREYYRQGWGLSWECLSVLCGAFILWLLPYFDVIGLKDVVLQRHKDNTDGHAGVI